jgi:hypothetical protein
MIVKVFEIKSLMLGRTYMAVVPDTGETKQYFISEQEAISSTAENLLWLLHEKVAADFPGQEIELREMSRSEATRIDVIKSMKTGTVHLQE